MEITQLIPYIISFLSLSIVLVQFFIKRNDERKNFILNKRFEIYQNFLENFTQLETEIGNFHTRINEIQNWKDSVKEVSLDEVKKIFNNFFKPILNFAFYPFPFNLISDDELNSKVQELFIIFDNRKKETLKKINKAESREECLSQFNYLTDKYDTNPEYIRQVQLLYRNILKLMRKDLGIK